MIKIHDYLKPQTSQVGRETFWEWEVCTPWLYINRSSPLLKFGKVIHCVAAEQTTKH